MSGYRSAIIGCGAVSRIHAAAISAAGASLCAVCDIVPPRAEAYAQKNGASVYTSFDKLLDSVELDFIHICTPHYLHLPMASAALRRGINTVLEKPPAMSYDEFRRLCRAEEESSASLCVCFQNRFNLTTEYVKDILDSKKYGELTGAVGTVTWNRQGEYYTESGWRGRYATEGGSVLINQALHTLDLLNFFMGRPTGVSSVCTNLSHSEIETEDTVCAKISYGGKSAVFYATVSAARSPDAQIRLFFEHAQIDLTAHECIIRPLGGKAEIISADEASVGKECWGSSHARLIGRFYSGLESGENPCPLSSCRDTMEVLSAIYGGGLKAAQRKEFI